MSRSKIVLSGRTGPTRLVLFAAYRATQRFNLPHQDKVQNLCVHHPEDHLGQVRLARLYTSLTLEEMEERAPREGMTELDVAHQSMRTVLGATTLVWKIRQAAQGTQAAAPSMEAWELLVMIIAVAYGRARENSTTLDLATWIDDLAIEITDL